MLPINTEPQKLFNCIINTVTNDTSKECISLILVDGYYGAGKTSFSNQLGRCINDCHKDYILLSTDEFMRYSRVERMRDQDTHTNHPGWYDLDKLSNAVSNILDRQSIHLRNLYNHKTGRLDIDRDIIAPETDFLIVEGMYACHPDLMKMSTMSIGLVASHETLLQRVLARDVIERHLPENTVLSRYWIINGHMYQSHLDSIYPTLNLAIEMSSFPKSIDLIKTSGIGNRIYNSIIHDSRGQ